MKILVINGDCILRNSSANLCHLAYLQGLVEAGHDITLLCADGKDYELDSNLVIPQVVKVYTYYGVSLYEKLSIRKNNGEKFNDTLISNTDAVSKDKKSKKERLKKRILSLYGIHGVYKKFVVKAQHFQSNVNYDYVISLSTPVTSHLLTHILLKKRHIRAAHWIQIWEDPWYSDAYGFNHKEAIYEEEKRLLSYAEKVCYVSPLTLQNQQKIFPEYADKMYWQPLPSYYADTNETAQEVTGYQYGYFGDYAPIARDLMPFYNAAVEVGISANICGNPSNLFETTNTIQIHPRLPLEQLKPIEEITNVLVFLCNRKGGQIPGKIYQYSATDKKILFILDGTEEEKRVLKEYFSQFNRYIFCENTKEDIAEKIRGIERGDYDYISRESLTCFAPKVIVEKILRMGEE